MALKMRWHQMSFECPRCKQEATILSVATAGDGQVLFSLVCPPCGVELQAVSTVAGMIAKAVMADIEESQEHRGPIRPMLKPPLWNEEDKKFEREIGIDPEEDKDET